MKTILFRHLQESATLQMAFFEGEMDHILVQGQDMVERLKRGCRILVCGNGGSAAQAQHFAAALNGRYAKERRALAGLALGACASSLTGLGEDFGLDRVFSRQIEALGRPGDLLVVLSTDGNSLNLTLAVESAKKLGLKTLGLLGHEGGHLKALCDDALIVPSQVDARIQEVQQMICHFWCEIIDANFD